MNKKLFLIFFFIFISNLLYSNHWLASLNKNDSNICLSGTLSPNHNEIIGVGITSTSDTNIFNSIIFKLDLQGNFLWGKIFGEGVDSLTQEIVKAEESSYIVVSRLKIGENSSGIILSKFDNKGNFIWKYVYKNDNLTNIYPKKILINNENIFVIGYNQAAYGDISKIFFLKFDLQGKFLSGKIFYSLNSNMLYGGTSLLVSDGILIFGERYYFDSKKTDLIIFKIDFNGNIKFLKKFDIDNSLNDYVTFFKKTQDNGFIAGGFLNLSSIYPMWLIKFDSQFNIIWKKQYNYSFWLEPKDLVETNDGFIISGSVEDSKGTFKGLILKVNKNNGNILLNKLFLKNKETYFNKVFTTSCDDLIFVGTNFSNYLSSNKIFSNIYILRTDKDVNILNCDNFEIGNFETENFNIKISNDNINSKNISFNSLNIDITIKNFFPSVNFLCKDNQQCSSQQEGNKNFAIIRDWYDTGDVFSFVEGKVCTGCGYNAPYDVDMFIGGIVHVFDAPGVIDMGEANFDDIIEAPESGYEIQVDAKLDHVYVIRSRNKYGKFKILSITTPPESEFREYKIEWFYQKDGTRNLKTTASENNKNTPPIINQFTSDKYEGNIPLKVKLQCNATDKDGKIIKYKWDIDGDNKTDFITNVNYLIYTYKNKGVFKPSVIVVDDNGSEVTSNHLEINVKDLFELEIYKGWNLVSLPIDTAITPEIFDKAYTVWLFKSNGWSIWSPNNKVKELLKKYNIPSFNELFPGTGFWVYSNIDFSLKFNGKEYGTEKFTIKPNWNIFGAGTDINLYSLPQLNNIKTVWVWDKDKWEIWSPNSNTIDIIKKFNLTIIKEIKRGIGFWIDYSSDVLETDNDSLYNPHNLFPNVNEIDIINEPPKITIQTYSTISNVNFEKNEGSIEISSAEIIKDNNSIIIVDKIFNNNIKNKPLFVDDKFRGIINKLNKINNDKTELILKDAQYMGEVYKNFNIELQNNQIKSTIKSSSKNGYFGIFDSINDKHLKVTLISKKVKNNNQVSKSNHSSQEELILRIDIPKGYYIPFISKSDLNCKFLSAECNFTFQKDFNKKLDLKKEISKNGITFTTEGSFIEIGIGSFIKAYYDHNVFTKDIFKLQFSQSAYFNANLSAKVSGKLEKEWNQIVPILFPIEIEIVHPYSYLAKVCVRLSPYITFGVKGSINGEVTASLNYTRKGEIRFNYDSSNGEANFFNPITHKENKLSKNDIKVDIEAKGNAYIFPNILIYPAIKFLRISKALTFVFIRSGIKLETDIEGKIEKNWVYLSKNNTEIDSSVNLKAILYGLLEGRWCVALGSIIFYQSKEYKELYKTGALKILNWQTKSLKTPKIIVKDNPNSINSKFVTFDIDEDKNYKNKIKFLYKILDNQSSNSNIPIYNLENYTPFWKIGNKPIEITGNKIIKVIAVLFNKDISSSIWNWGYSVSSQAEKNINANINSCPLTSDDNITIDTNNNPEDNTYYECDYYPNGKLMAEGNIIDGKMEGVVKYYSDKGILITEANYINGKLNGVTRYYNEIDGSLDKDVNYKDGVPNGYMIKYCDITGYSDLAKQNNIKILKYKDKYYYACIKTPYVNGVINGTQIFTLIFSPDIINRTYTQYKNNLKDGIEKFYQNNNLIGEDYFEMGEKKWTKSYFENGDLQYESIFINGQEFVKYEKKYDDNNKFKYWIENKFNKDSKLTERILYCENGKMYQHYFFKLPDFIYENKNGYYDVVSNEIINYTKKIIGKYEEYYCTTGGLHIVENYDEKGKLNGEFISYYENGNMEEKGTYKDGKKDGIWTYYYESGGIHRVKTYSNGILNGVVKTYYKSGGIQELETYSNGILNGVVETYYENGNMEEKGTYKDGKKDGIWTYYYKSGGILGLDTYSNDILNGVVKTYYENGYLSSIGYYTNNLKNGEFKVYDKAGNLVSCEVYSMNNYIRSCMPPPSKSDEKTN